MRPPGSQAAGSSALLGRGAGTSAPAGPARQGPGAPSPGRRERSGSGHCAGGSVWPRGRPFFGQKEVRAALPSWPCARAPVSKPPGHLSPGRKLGFRGQWPGPLLPLSSGPASSPVKPRGRVAGGTVPPAPSLGGGTLGPSESCLCLPRWGGRAERVSSPKQRASRPQWACLYIL